MGLKEPVRAQGSAAPRPEVNAGPKEVQSKVVSKKLFKKGALFALAIQLAASIQATQSLASSFSTDELFKLRDAITQLSHPSAPAWRKSASVDLATLVDKAEQALMGRHHDMQPVFDEGPNVRFEAITATSDSYSTSVRFTQSYKGLEVVGQEAMVHFSSEGELHDVTGKKVELTLETEPSLSALEARRLLDDRFGQHVKMSSEPALKVLIDFEGKPHLVYHLLTRSTATHEGHEVYLDAHTGAVVLEFERAIELTPRGKRTIYTADTDKARKNIDDRGYPTDLDVEWYEKVIEDGERSEDVDRSALNAYRSSGLVFSYFKENFSRNSFDDKGTRLVSVVHMGMKMNNAFWTSEYQLMAYGDGDGDRLTDLTFGLDVAAHELTHGVTASTAKLVYAAEAGALNESYSDFFGKMVDYGDWDIGARIVAPKWGRRALRNMEKPEEFKQPAEKGGKYWVSTSGPCTRGNDRCGVHTNSGVPNHAAVLIVKAIGKEKTEQLYYKVLTHRLSATSTFKDARRETEKECALRFGEDSKECAAVSAAFDTVKM